ncbi:hypothetical protein DFO73_101513 [Cytobacillus oceanisediminis]|uniref:Uncharacterized protein n=1 Tax=Cytobacillus oceanisediminis TaxID=665099 RepID=A0A2V3A844_9BACI|nr:hypothetical protein DFO73_101513 [Cytobacillus oceanisediminis]
MEGVLTAGIDSDGNVIHGTEKVTKQGIAGGLYPLAELAAVAVCPFQYIPELGGHVPHHSEKMETPLAGLFVAGNITGIESGKNPWPKEQPLDFPLPNTLEKAV